MYLGRTAHAPCGPFQLPNYFQRELNLPFRRDRPHKRSGDWIPGSGAVEDVGIAVTDRGGTEIGVIQDVKDLRPKLNVEIFGDSPNIVVLENRKIEIGQSWTNQDIASGVSAEVEAAEIAARKRSAEARRSRRAVGVPERRIRRGG